MPTTPTDLTWAQVLPAVTGLVGVVVGSLVQLAAGIWNRRATAIQSWEEKSVEARRTAYGQILAQLAQIQWLLLAARGNPPESAYWRGDEHQETLRRFDKETDRLRELVAANALLLSEEFLDAFVASFEDEEGGEEDSEPEQVRHTMVKYGTMRSRLEQIARRDLQHPMLRKRQRGK